jgi:hypothetical protein
VVSDCGNSVRVLLEHYAARLSLGRGIRNSDPRCRSGPARARGRVRSPRRGRQTRP